jgi:uncharacterized protein YprB with RNaseH-like and TPR domain
MPVGKVRLKPGRLNRKNQRSNRHANVSSCAWPPFFIAKKEGFAQNAAVLQRSFIHLPGIGPSKEKMLWSRGVGDWDHLLREARGFFPAADAGEMESLLRASRVAWEARDAYFFYQQLPRQEHWRLVSEFHDSIAFLDIETDGLYLPPHSRSTTITFRFRGQLYQEHAFEAKARLLDKMAAEAALFCSYYGDVFDLPFLRREFGRPLRKAHLDLCFWLKRLGFNGGLKRVETCFPGIYQRRFRNIAGPDAARLWRFHQQGRKGALEALLAYNAEDVLVLEGLLAEAYNLELDARPHLDLPSLTLPVPEPPATRVAPEIYEWLEKDARINPDA